MDSLFCTDGYEYRTNKGWKICILTVKNNDERMYVFVMSW